MQLASATVAGVCASVTRTLPPEGISSIQSHNLPCTKTWHSPVAAHYRLLTPCPAPTDPVPRGLDVITYMAFISFITYMAYMTCITCITSKHNSPLTLQPIPTISTPHHSITIQSCSRPTNLRTGNATTHTLQPLPTLQNRGNKRTIPGPEHWRRTSTRTHISIPHRRAFPCRRRPRLPQRVRPALAAGLQGRRALLDIDEGSAFRTRVKQSSCSSKRDLIWPKRPNLAKEA